MMQDIKENSLDELKAILLSWKEKPFHAKQIFSWLYKKHVQGFEQMSDLPKDLKICLKDNFRIFSLQLCKLQESSDGTKKFLFYLRDANLIETVLIPAERRLTGCISTQAGCKFACLFCASALSGFKRDLTSAEIVEQALFLKSDTKDKLSHLVFMGMGEPLDNYENTLKAIRIINDPEGLRIGARKITISTCGIIPGIKRLGEEKLQVELSVSLHAADEKTRSQIMPVNKRYPLKNLIRACSEYIKKTNRQVTFEYILIDGINSGLQSAKDLNRMLEGLNCKVNLIPANPVEECRIEPPNKPDILLFRDYLLKNGVNVTLRKPRGRDIQAACGQLRLRYEKAQSLTPGHFKATL